MAKSNINIVLDNLQREIKARIDRRTVGILDDLKNWPPKKIAPLPFSGYCNCIGSAGVYLIPYKGHTYILWEDTPYMPYFCPECGQIWLIARNGSQQIPVELGGF